MITKNRVPEFLQNITRVNHRSCFFWKTHFQIFSLFNFETSQRWDVAVKFRIFWIWRISQWTQITSAGIWANQMIVYIQDGFPCHFKGGRKMLLSGFFPLMGYIPRTPLAENHFAKRPLSVMGGTPPPLTEIPPSFSGKIPKRAKNGVFVINKVKKGPKRPWNRPKRSKNVLKGARNRFFGPKIPCF